MKITRRDVDLIKQSWQDGNLFTQAYLAGMKFQPWQLLLHHAKEENITVIGGVGSGKTVGVGASAAAWAASTSYFAFMDLAPTSWQASLMHADILRRAEAGLYAERFIEDAVVKPYPKITLYNHSTLEFMTAQDDIERLRSWEGDWMNLDEGGFIATLATTIGVMRSRLRGITATGRPRLSRLSVVGTSTDNPELWERFDKHYEDPGTYLSMIVRTRDNPYISERDLLLMEADIPEELRAAEMDSERPTGRGQFFPLHLVRACEDPTLNNLAHRATLEDPPVRGMLYVEEPRLGVTLFQMPWLPGHEYLIIGDPGTGNPPRRNAGSIGVFDITGFPDSFDSQAKMVAFAWVAGKGRYDAFVERYKTWWEYYHCGLCAALEATGPQKSFAEYAFTMGLDGQRMLIEGMDLSGNKKNEALQAAIQLFNRGLFRIPFIRGLRGQLTNYSLPDTKLAQDNVSMIMVAAAWLRQWRVWGRDQIEVVTGDQDLSPPIDTYARAVRAEPLAERPER